MARSDARRDGREAVDTVCRLIHEHFDDVAYQRHARTIWNLEKSGCYADFARSAAFCRDGLKHAGLQNCRLIPLKADGVTVYGDFIMPEAYDVREARLEIIDPPGVVDPILADTPELPFCVANRCGPTPPGGIEAEVVYLASPEEPADLNGKMVFADSIWPSRIRGRVVHEQGAGIISAMSSAQDEPLGTYWINGWGGGPGWYQTRADAKLPCFSIPPGRGARLRALLQQGRPVRVRACVDSAISPGNLFSVTGLLPGRQPREILFTAHLFEPMLTDNAASVGALIEIARTLHDLLADRRLPPLEYGIRFLFSMERYGTAHYFRKPRPEIITAINADCIAIDPAQTGNPALRLKQSALSRPFFGDALFDDLLERQFPACWPVRRGRADFADDTFISGPGCGIPSVYLASAPGKFHHNSLEAGVVDWCVGGAIARVMADYACLLASASRPVRAFVQQLAATRPPPTPPAMKRGPAAALPPLRREAASRLITRVATFPFCLSRFPAEARQPLPPELHAVLGWADGRRDLDQMLRCVDWERSVWDQPPLNDGEKMDVIRFIDLLARYGYLEMSCRKTR